MIFRGTEMSIATQENLILNKFTAVDFLTNGSGRTILLNDISWQEYEMFLEDFEEKSGWRLAYDTGKLEIMPPTQEHEIFSFSFSLFVVAFCEHFNLDVQGAGSTTFRRMFLNKGVEPDECFYIKNAEKVIGKKFKSDECPMPDVAVEVDVTTDSLDKFPIYAALQIPEIWIFDGKNVFFYQLEGEKYNQISKSIALTPLSSETLTEYLNLSEKKGQTFALKSFRQYLNELK
jgi:Uma2 family endonuclease